MNAVRLALLIVHLVALVALLGYSAVLLVSRRGRGAVLPAAAGAMLVTGLLLVASRAGAGLPLNGPKLGVKGIIAVGVIGLALAARRGAPAAVSATAVAALVNAVVAVTWR